jgi:hypothetical protein
MSRLPEIYNPFLQEDKICRKQGGIFAIDLTNKPKERSYSSF